MRNSTRYSTLLFLAAISFSTLSAATLEAQLLQRRFVSYLVVPPPIASLPAVDENISTLNPTVEAINPNTGWYPYVIARPEHRQWIRETPMELRPNRPLHFWGNSRRRMSR